MANRRYPAWRAPIDRVVSLPPVAASLRQLMHRLDIPLMKLTRGRFNLTLGLPSILLTTTGAKTGLARSSPLLYVNFNDDIAIIGTRFGGNSNPGWVFNLRKKPVAEVLHNGKRYTVTARVASADERRQLWTEADRIYIGFEKYRERVTDREIPMFILKRV